MSVVVPTYDRPDLLESAVRSVVDQTYDRLELLVVDDGGRTDVRGALETLSLSSLADVRVLAHETNRGANAARNTGVEHASGEYVAFLDDDDYWRPEKIERQVRQLRAADDDVGIAFVGRVDVDPTGTVVNVGRPTRSGDFTRQLVTGSPFGTFSTVLARTEVFDRTGPLDERFPCWQDREWYFRVARHYDYVSLTDLLTVRRITDGPQISDDYEAKRDVAYPLLLEKHAGTVADAPSASERRFRAELTRGVGAAAVSSGAYVEALRYLLRSLRHQPVNPSTLGYLLVALGGRYTHRLAQLGRRVAHRGLSDGSTSGATDDPEAEPPGG